MFKNWKKRQPRFNLRWQIYLGVDFRLLCKNNEKLLFLTAVLSLVFLFISLNTLKTCSKSLPGSSITLFLPGSILFSDY